MQQGVSTHNFGTGEAGTVKLKRREDDWAVHIYRAPNNEADACVLKGAGGLEGLDMV